jgi:hypothetical protein
MAVGPAVLLPLHDRLKEPSFWALVALIVLPSAFITLHLDRVADRPERLRGWSDAEGHEEAAAEAALVPALSPEA